MKGITLLLVVVVLACVPPAWGQGTMYDYSYQGPRNYYGQPQYEPVPGARQNQPQGYQGQGYGPYGQGQRQWVPNGYIPQSVNALQRLGGFFWGYMPAPLRGQPARYPLQPLPDGSVSIINVPGNP